MINFEKDLNEMLINSQEELNREEEKEVRLSNSIRRVKKNIDSDDLVLSKLYQEDIDETYQFQENAYDKKRQKVKMILIDEKNKTEDLSLKNIDEKSSNIATSGSVFLELINSKSTRKNLPNQKTNGFAKKNNSFNEENDFVESSNTNKIVDKKAIHNKLKFRDFDTKTKSFDEYFDDEIKSQENVNKDYVLSKKSIVKKKKNKTNKNLFRNNFDLTKDYSKEVSTLKSKIDSILHVAGENGVSSHDLQRACEIDREHLKIVLNELKKQYDAEDSGIILVEFGDKFKVLTTNKNKSIVSRFVTTTQKNPLSQSVLETLAIIAYNKTASRSFIEKIRAKDPKSAIDTLLKHGLIKNAGFAKGPGRAILYTVTQTFFDKFGIQDFADLPKLNKDIPVVEVEETE